jgi:hypothetical protein
MGLSKIGTHQHSRLTWRFFSGDKEKILKNCQNEPTSKTIIVNFFLKFQVDSALMVPKKIATGLCWDTKTLSGVAKITSKHPANASGFDYILAPPSRVRLGFNSLNQSGGQMRVWGNNYYGISSPLKRAIKKFLNLSAERQTTI